LWCAVGYFADSGAWRVVLEKLAGRIHDSFRTLNIEISGDVRSAGGGENVKVAHCLWRNDRSGVADVALLEGASKAGDGQQGNKAEERAS